MEKEELIARLGVSMDSRMVANSTAIIESNDLNIPDVLGITFHQKKEVAFRASWMLEYIFVHRPVDFSPHIATFFTLLPDQRNPSAMRHYAKIVSLLTGKKVNPVCREALQRIDLDPVIEVMFTWLVDEEVLVATKVHCMQALANLAPNYNWIKDELLETIDHLAAKESYAFFARAKQVRKSLKKI